MFSKLGKARDKYPTPLSAGVVTAFLGLVLALAFGIFAAGGPTAAASGSYSSNVPPGVPTAVPTVPAVCLVSFSDVPSTNPFYQYVRCLACRNVLGGYSDGTFRPNNNVTRGQLAKMVASAAGYNDALDSNRQTFHDIAPNTTYWQYVERVAMHNVTSGYTCGGPNEPCDDQHRPYFRPNDNVTRQQVAKMVALAYGLTSNRPSANNVPPAEPTSPTVTYTFADVLPTNAFYPYVEALAHLGSINGYDCGGPNAPCDSNNRKYFRPGYNMSRGQIAKVLSLTFFPTCNP